MHILKRETCSEKPFCTICERYQELRYHGKEAIPTWRFNVEKNRIAKMLQACPAQVITVEQMGEDS